MNCEIVSSCSILGSAASAEPPSCVPSSMAVTATPSRFLIRPELLTRRRTPARAVNRSLTLLSGSYHVLKVAEYERSAIGRKGLHAIFRELAPDPRSRFRFRFRKPVGHAAVDPHAAAGRLIPGRS